MATAAATKATAAAQRAAAIGAARRAGRAGRGAGSEAGFGKRGTHEAFRRLASASTRPRNAGPADHGATERGRGRVPRDGRVRHHQRHARPRRPGPRERQEIVHCFGAHCMDRVDFRRVRARRAGARGRSAGARGGSTRRRRPWRPAPSSVGAQVLAPAHAPEDDDARAPHVAAAPGRRAATRCRIRRRGRSRARSPRREAAPAVASPTPATATRRGPGAGPARGGHAVLGGVGAHEDGERRRGKGREGLAARRRRLDGDDVERGKDEDAGALRPRGRRRSPRTAPAGA